METVKNILPIVIFFSQLLLGLGVWALNQKFVSKKECAKHRGNVDFRTVDIEKNISAMPSSKEIQELHQEIGTLNKELGITQGRLKGLNRAVDLINEYLLNHGIK